MADKKELYWIGKGVPFIGSKPWDVKKPLPVDNFKEEWLAAQIKKGNIGEKLQAKAMVSDTAEAEIKRLEKLVLDQKAEIELLKEENAKLKDRIPKKNASKGEDK